MNPHARIERLASLAGDFPALESALAREAAVRFVVPTLIREWRVVEVDAALADDVREALEGAGCEVRVVDGTMEARKR